MKYSLLIGLIGLGILASSCDREPVFPVEPKIEYLDIQPREVTQFTDSILVTFRFQDGDGDLGSNDPDNPNLVLLDSRFSEGRIPNQRDAENTFAIPSLTPEAKNPSIQGEDYGKAGVPNYSRYTGIRSESGFCSLPNQAI